jgi:hypothetical protein
MAPNTGIEKAIKADEIPLPKATIVFDAWRSETNQTAKYNVAIFIEKIVFAKSYSAQLQRSLVGALVAMTSPSFVIIGFERGV